MSRSGQHPRMPTMYPKVVESASRLAARGHYRQFRKRGAGSRPCTTVGEPLAEDCIPYVTHLTGVACILASVGAEPEVLAGALLHDYLEDVPDGDGRRRIEAEVGPGVLALVLELTEDKRRGRAQSETWRERKEEAIRRISTMSDGAVLIKAADMAHNLGTMVFDFEKADNPPEIWDRFNADARHQLWYFDEVHRAVSLRLGQDHPLVNELAHLVGLVKDCVP